MSRPNQPLPRPSEMALAPPPNGIITPNTAGVGATVNLDTQAALAPALGMAKIGAGITEAGGALSQLSEKYAEAKSISQQAEAQRRMEEAETLITMETAAEPDETKWAAIADKHITKAKEAVSQIPMSVRTAEMVRPALDRWQMHRMDGVKIEAQKTGIKRAVGDLNYKIQNAKLTGNGAALEQNLKARRQLGASTDGQDENDRIEFQQQQQKKAEAARKAQVYDEATTDPDGWLKRYATRPADMPPELHAYGDAKAKEAIRERTSTTVDRFEDAVAGGEITVPDEVDKWEEGNPNIRPTVRSQLKASLLRRQDANAKERARATAPEESSALLTKIRGMDPDKATDEDFVKLSTAINELPVGYRQLPRDVLNRRWRKYEGEDTAAEKSMLGYGEKLMGSMYDGGDFGFTTDIVPVLDVNGKPVIDTETLKPKVKIVTNHEKEQQALTAKAKLGGLFRRWFMNNPKATEEDVHKWLKEHADSATLIRAADDYKAKAAAATTAPPVQSAPPVLEQAPAGTSETPPENVPLQGALPDNPGPASNAILPTAPPGTGFMQLTQEDLKGYKERGIKTTRSYNSKTRQWEKVSVDKLQAGDMVTVE